MLTRLWDFDPQLARVADLGLPGVIEQSIYGYLMHKIQTFNPIMLKRNNHQFRFGVDWGESISATSCSFIALDKQHKWVAIIGE